jgi:1-acyl-sn-glycerol-3-phosphate acyltransferase
VSDWYYRLVRFVGRSAFIVSSRPVVLHAERADRKGAYIVASTHLSAYDVPVLIRHTSRLLDFVSIVEVFRVPLARWFFTNMNAMPLDRGRVDTVTTRQVLDRLGRGRVVAMFPEGRLQDEAGSVLNGGKIRTGIFGIARKANVPIIPCVVLGTRAYRRLAQWMPVRGTVYGMNYGEPIFPSERWDDLEVAEEELREVYQQLHRELLEEMKGLPVE